MSAEGETKADKTQNQSSSKQWNDATQKTVEINTKLSKIKSRVAKREKR